MVSTKAFTAQFVALILLTLALAQARQRLSKQDELPHFRALRHLLDAMTRALALEPWIVGWAEQLARKAEHPVSWACHALSGRSGICMRCVRAAASYSCAISVSPGIKVIRVTDYYDFLSLVLHSTRMKRLAFHAALARGTDIGKPRNLAESVTVED